MKMRHSLLESSFSMNLTEQRILYLACKQLRSIFMKMNIKSSEVRNAYEKQTFDIIKVFVSDYKKQYEVKGNNNYILLQDTTETINAQMIKLLDINEVVKLGAFNYNSDERCIDIMFNPDLIVKLLELKEVYGLYKYTAVKNFKKAASFRLYELLYGLNDGESRTFKLEDLKIKLGLAHDGYPDFYEFKRSLLWPSFKEIVSFTDIKKIDMEELKECKKTHSITLKIKRFESEEDVPVNPLYRVSKEETDRISLVVGKELTEDQAERLTSTVILAIAKNDVDMGFYEYIEHLKELGVPLDHYLDAEKK